MHEGTTKSLERISLQFEALKTTNEELEKKYVESEAKVAGLNRQVQQWAKLENRENADLESLRKSRVQLEVQVKKLEAENEEIEKQRAADEARAEKLKLKLDKFKDAWEAHAVSMVLFQTLICRSYVSRSQKRRLHKLMQRRPNVI